MTFYILVFALPSPRFSDILSSLSRNISADQAFADDNNMRKKNHFMSLLAAATARRANPSCAAAAMCAAAAVVCVCMCIHLYYKHLSSQ